MSEKSTHGVMKWLPSLLVLLAFAVLGSGGWSAAGVLSGCGGDTRCQDDRDCDSGLYCDDRTGECIFDCQRNKPCKSGEVCTIRGRCIPDEGGKKEKTAQQDGGGTDGGAEGVGPGDAGEDGMVLDEEPGDFEEWDEEPGDFEMADEQPDKGPKDEGPSCKHECDKLGDKGCDGDKSWVCEEDSQGCRVKRVTPCGKGETCDGGVCTFKYPAGVCGAKKVKPCSSDADCDKIYKATGKKYKCVKRKFRPPPDRYMCLMKCPSSGCMGGQVCRDGACQMPDPICKADADCDKIYKATGKKYQCVSYAYREPTGLIPQCLQKCSADTDCPPKSGYECKSGVCELTKGIKQCSSDADCDKKYGLPGKFKCVHWQWKKPAKIYTCAQKCKTDTDCTAGLECK